MRTVFDIISNDDNLVTLTEKNGGKSELFAEQLLDKQIIKHNPKSHQLISEYLRKKNRRK